MFTSTMSDRAVLAELGRRLARYRLNRNMTQKALAAEAGLSTPTIQRLEGGRPTQTSNLIRVLRSLKLLEQLDALVPTPSPSPVELAKLHGRTRQRASTHKSSDEAAPWSWEDDV